MVTLGMLSKLSCKMSRCWNNYWLKQKWSTKKMECKTESSRQRLQPCKRLEPTQEATQHSEFALCCWDFLLGLVTLHKEIFQLSATVWPSPIHQQTLRGTHIFQWQNMTRFWLWGEMNQGAEKWMVVFRKSLQQTQELRVKSRDLEVTYLTVNPCSAPCQQQGG